MAAQFEDVDEEFLDAVDAADDEGLVEIDNELMEELDEVVGEEMERAYEEGDPGDEVDAEPAEEEPEPEPEPEPERQERAERPQQGPDFNRLAAKTRIMERDVRIMAERLQEAAERNERLERLLADRLGTEPGLKEGEELPPLEVDAETHIKKRFERVERELAETKERERREALQRESEAIHRDAFVAATQFAAQDPIQYNEAVRHLSGTLLQEAMERNPNKTQAEISKALTGRVKELFVEWYKNGVNPGEMVYNLAVERGFRWEPQQSQDRRPAAAGARGPARVGKYGEGVAEPPRRAKAETRDDVRRARERDRKVGSISRVPGSPSKARNQERRLAADEETYEKETRGVPLRELLKGHEARIR